MFFGICISILTHLVLLVFIVNQMPQNRLLSKPALTKHELLFYPSQPTSNLKAFSKNQQRYIRKVESRTLSNLEPKITKPDAYPSTDSSHGNLSQSPPFLEYAMALRSQINQKLKYPYSIRKRKLVGRVIIQLIWNPFENAPLIEVKASSGHACLDRLALKAVQDGLKETPFDRDRIFGNPIARKNKLECNQTIEFKLADAQF